VSTPLLSVRGLAKEFPVRSRVLRRRVGHVSAVDGVDFDVRRGETLGLVGESGCGKTTLSRTILRLVEPTAGSISFEGTDVVSLSRRELRLVRRDMQLVFQNPYGALNPRLNVLELIAEPLRIHGRLRAGERVDRVTELTERVGLGSDFLLRYPHELSGGQRQRVVIARALALHPKLLILDEPVAALDVSIRAQIVNLLVRLQTELGLSYIFISHDLSLVEHVADRVAVMYLGRIVELGERDDIYERSTHPYTQALLSAIPIAEPQERGTTKRIILQGDVPSALAPPSGCRFRTRCWKAQAICAVEEPALTDRGEGHPSACHFPELPQQLNVSA
jgi:oligopeptide/dipeptide ABC transporter ATP-binding protein